MKRHPNTQRSAQASSEAGFTLVEALIAVLILIIGLAAIANLFIVAGASNTVANQSTAAATAASEQMELLKSTPFLQLGVPAAGTTVGDVENDVANFNVDNDFPGVGRVHTRWEIRGLDNQTAFIRVRSEGMGALTGRRTRAEFTTIRSCTDVGRGCPTP
jgi:type II secretory pathway pseudopilin PulG